MNVIKQLAATPGTDGARRVLPLSLQGKPPLLTP